MDIMEAYDLTMQKVDELKADGVESIIEPYKGKSTREGDPLPRDKWVRVTFKVEDKNDSQKILDAMKYLDFAGIAFDSGGTACQRDWELDWSFHLTEVGEDFELRERLEEVEDLIENDME